MKMRQYLIAGTLALIGACSGPTDTCACSPAPAQATVFGRVTQDGNAASAATVTAFALDQGCDPETANIIGHTTGTAADDGAYRLHIYLSGPESVRCVVVDAGYSQPLTSTSDPVSLDFRTRAPFDSVRIDIALGPRPVSP